MKRLRLYLKAVARTWLDEITSCLVMRPVVTFVYDVAFYFEWLYLRFKHRPGDYPVVKIILGNKRASIMNICLPQSFTFCSHPKLAVNNPLALCGRNQRCWLPGWRIETRRADSALVPVRDS